ncbi:MAG: hypothetical protein K2X03_06570 [Bryobacteraceae bacterium]|nr:hypothetical protein [Bryobacteraceae bacterium]
MNNQRLACILLGAWLSGSLILAAIAVGNFRITDRILLTPGASGAAKALETLGSVEARYLLRYQTGEINRALFEYWGLAQLGLGLLLFFLLLFGTLASKKTLIVSFALVVLVAVNQFAIMPSIIGLGRAVEFSDSTKFPSHRKQLEAMHGLYATFEALKVLTGLGLAGLLVLSRTDRKRRGSRTPKLDTVNHTDHSHVNR